jgi:hypothetical protein
MALTWSSEKPDTPLTERAANCELESAPIWLVDRAETCAAGKALI